MGNKAVIIPFIVAVALLGAAFLFTPRPAAAAERTSMARGIMDMVTQRLCDRQAALGGRVTLVNPSRCSETPEPTPKPTVNFSANPTTIDAGSSSTLTWSTTNATLCMASTGWSGAKSISGSTSVSPTQTTTYKLTCTGAGGSTSKEVTITVTYIEPEDPTVDLTASPTTISEGSNSVLSWTTTNATSCTKSVGWSGATTTSGTLSVAPIATTTYSIECSGPGGTASDSVTVNVILTPEEEPDAPTVNLTAAPTSVTPGAGSATTTLSWTSTNATSCTASGGSFTGSKALNGTEIITPSATTTYVLTCTGDGGSANDSVIVNFVPTPAQEPTPTVNHLLISEVHYNPDAAHGVTGSPDDNEWVEIYNPTGATVTMNNWWIGDTASTIDRIPNGTVIPAGGYLVISQSSSTPSFWPSTSATFVSLEAMIGGGLANTNDAVFLFDASGATTTVDSVSWGTNVLAFNPGAASVADGQSLARSVLTTDTDTAADWSTLASPSFGF